MRALTSINGETRLVGIIGDPVRHSLSPAMHNAAFASLGINMAYVPLRVSAERLSAAVATLPALGFRGANVTVPHKTAVVSLLDELRDDAVLIQAVNTIVIEGDRLVGHNTDVEGFRRALHEADAQPLEGAGVLLVGAGGAARAAALAVARQGLAELVVANRGWAAADRLVSLLRDLVPGLPCRALALAELGAADVRRARLIVNATTLGMQGESKVPGVLVDNVGVDQVVYDMVYGARPTGLVSAARARGARTVDGLAMLIWQAAVAFELWTGAEAPVDVMKRAVGR